MLIILGIFCTFLTIITDKNILLAQRESNNVIIDFIQSIKVSLY